MSLVNTCVSRMFLVLSAAMHQSCEPGSPKQPSSQVQGPENHAALTSANEEETAPVQQLSQNINDVLLELANHRFSVSKYCMLIMADYINVVSNVASHRQSGILLAFVQ